MKCLKDGGKIKFLYRIVNTITGRVYYGVHASNDVMFATPRWNLMEVHWTERLCSASDRLPENLWADILLYGKHNFIIEAIASHHDRNTLKRHKNMLVGNAPPGKLYNLNNH